MAQNDRLKTMTQNDRLRTIDSKRWLKTIGSKRWLEAMSRSDTPKQRPKATAQSDGAK